MDDKQVAASPDGGVEFDHIPGCECGIASAHRWWRLYREQRDQMDVLRKLLWLRHGCSVSALYGDDGEMQCSACGIDFRRLSPDLIEQRFRQINEKYLPEINDLIRQILGVDDERSGGLRLARPEADRKEHP